jgi:SAM-dependent methyltransferase
MKNNLYQKEVSKHFYESRYEKGYMKEWPIDKLQRVFEIIRILPLPESGFGLDFGCGNGVFTNILRHALPKWKIYGCDISSNAINNAKNRFPECTFFVSDNDHPIDLKFDFLFSHHVLEHVFDIKKTVNEINDYLKNTSFILHIFPCGNEDSFEYKVCKMKINGINGKMENRFFFEDEGHVRRLTTEQSNRLMSKYEFVLEEDFYSNQYYGTVKWISQASPLRILAFTNPKNTIDKKAYKYLLILRFRFILLFILQLPANLYNRIKLVSNKKLIHYCILIIDFIPAIISYPLYAFVNSKAKIEWNNNKHLKNGSEMYLFYSRKK